MPALTSHHDRSSDASARSRQPRDTAQEPEVEAVEHTTEAGFHLDIAAGFSQGPRCSIPRPSGLALADVAALSAF